MKSRKMAERRLMYYIREVLAASLTPAGQVSTVARDFEDAGICYAIVGGLALAPHNYSRNTDDIDILVSKSTFPLIEEHLIGRGYTKRPGSKNLYFHTSQNKIHVDIMVEGVDYELPHPRTIRTKIHGLWYVSLPELIAMKLRSKRLKDQQDVGRLIELNDLNLTFAVPADVRDIYLKMLETVSCE